MNFRCLRPLDAGALHLDTCTCEETWGQLASQHLNVRTAVVNIDEGVAFVGTH